MFMLDDPDANDINKRNNKSNIIKNNNREK